MDELLDWARERWGLLVMAGLAVSLGLWWWQGRPLSHSAGVLAPEDPIQTEPDSPASWEVKQHLITPLARFHIRARVLSAERYRFDRPSELSPVDLALGWGPMSDSRVLESFSIQQRDRWYFWSASHMPISATDVITHSANMHMIPSNRLVRGRLLDIRAGQIVELQGKLVRVDGKDGWHWISSLSRADTGDGSCEVIWVDSVNVADR